MARFTLHVYLSDEQDEYLTELCRVYGVSKATFLRPHIARAILAEWNTINAPDEKAFHERIIKRAIRSHNHTLTEIENWTGLDRAIIQTTLNEMKESGAVWMSRGQYKIINYWLKEQINDKAKRVED